MIISETFIPDNGNYYSTYVVLEDRLVCAWSKKKNKSVNILEERKNDRSQETGMGRE